MEQHKAVNRLYWLNANGDWELTLESDNAIVIMAKANHLAETTAQGVVGYAKYPTAHDYQRWTMYRRHEGGISRASRKQDDIPKTIQLLEFLS